MQLTTPPRSPLRLSRRPCCRLPLLSRFAFSGRPERPSPSSLVRACVRVFVSQLPPFLSRHPLPTIRPNIWPSLLPTVPLFYYRFRPRVYLHTIVRLFVKRGSGCVKVTFCLISRSYHQLSTRCS